MLQAALNIDNSVSRIGFYGPAAEKLWVQTHTETLTLWEWAAACQEDASGKSPMQDWQHASLSSLWLTYVCCVCMYISRSTP